MSALPSQRFALPSPAEERQAFELSCVIDELWRVTRKLTDDDLTIAALAVYGDDLADFISDAADLMTPDREEMFMALESYLEAKRWAWYGASVLGDDNVRHILDSRVERKSETPEEVERFIELIEDAISNYRKGAKVVEAEAIAEAAKEPAA